MFTGLVEDRGTVHAIRSEGAAIRLEIDVPESLAGGCQVGDSVAINGCCLTVVDIEANRWAFQAGEETLSKTNLGDFKPGVFVNLERSLPVDARLGGHFVLGHVDGVAQVASIESDGEWVTMWFAVSDDLARLMVTKGSVAVDGISLTIVDIETDRFSVALIPHTLDVTTLGIREVGDRINIETDILGKYVQKLMVDGEK